MALETNPFQPTNPEIPSNIGQLVDNLVFEAEELLHDAPEEIVTVMLPPEATQELYDLVELDPGGTITDVQFEACPYASTLYVGLDNGQLHEYRLDGTITEYEASATHVLRQPTDLDHALISTPMTLDELFIVTRSLDAAKITHEQPS